MIIFKKDNGYLVEWNKYTPYGSRGDVVRTQISRVCTKQSEVLIAVQEYLTDKEAS